MSTRQQEQDRKVKVIFDAAKLYADGQKAEAAQILVSAGIAQSEEVAIQSIEAFMSTMQDTRPAPRTTLLGMPIHKGYRWNRHFGDGEIWTRGDGLNVIETTGVHDGQIWYHVSCSFAKKMPSYDDLAQMKDFFVGPDRQAIQIFPRSGKHVSIHEYALHLWSNLSDPDWLPDFAPGGTI